MKKPYKEEKEGLKIEVKIIKFLLLVFFLTAEIFPQIPINGFCKYNSFPVDTNYTSLLSLNFNKDFYTDLLLYKPGNKNIVIVKGEKNGRFNTGKVYELPMSISAISPLFSKGKGIEKYAFISRENRKAGIYDFLSDGRPKLLKEINFHSFPGNLSTGDVTDDGKDEILVSGSSFNGLSLLYPYGYKIEQKKIVENVSYSDAILVDITNDYKPDIVGFNVVTNSFDFFTNDGHGKFVKQRTINVGHKITSLHSLDLNLDYYQDLIYVKDKSIDIIYGDYQGSYDTTTSIQTKFHPDKIITGDFNKDGKIDIAYINYRNSILSIIYGKDENSFYPEIIYTQKKNLVDLIPYYSRFIDGIAALTENGNLFTITKLTSVFDNVNIMAGVNPQAITYFDNENNGVYDIAYIDNFNNTLNLYLRNTTGIPNMYYSFKLFKDHKSILTESIGPREKIFYCYSFNERLVESIKINFANNHFERNSIYASGKIKALKLKHDMLNRSYIYVAYVKDDYLGMNIFQYNDYKLKTSDYTKIAKNVTGVALSLLKSNELIYWQYENNSLVLNYAIPELNRNNQITAIPASVDDSIKVITYTEDFWGNKNIEALSFIKTPRKKFAVLSSNQTATIIKEREVPVSFSPSENSQSFFGEIKNNGLKKLFIYSPNNEIINRIDFLATGKDISFSKVVGNNRLGNYFIKNMNYKEFHLVYTNQFNNCITLKKLY